MSNQITTAFVNQYRGNVSFLLQQQGSMMRDKVRNVSQSAEFDYHDRIGSTTAVENTSRHGDTPLIHTPHDRRRVSLRDYDWADLIDNKDKIRTLIDPTSPYAVNASWAIGRAMDDLIIEQLFADAQTGKTGTGTASFDSSNMRVAMDYVESGSAANSGLTIGKLRKARTNLREQENLQRDDKWYIGVMPAQMQDLLTTTEVTSSDFNTVKALVQGEVNTFMNFTFVEHNRYTTIASNQRRCPYWCHSGMLLAIGQDITADIGPRRDKRNSVQVYVASSFGGVRMEEGKVGDIICDES